MNTPTLHGYQRQAVDWLRAHHSGLLALPVGAGKSAVILTALREEDFPALVIAPPRVSQSTWPSEAETWAPGLRVASVAGAAPHVRREALEHLGDHDLITISNSALKDLEHVPTGAIRTVILDEAQGFKDPSSVRFKALAKFLRAQPSRPRVIQASATPAPNSLMDLYPLAALLGTHALGKTLTEFRNRWFSPGRALRTGTIVEWLMRPGAEAEIWAAMAPHMLSVGTQSAFTLPERIDSTIHFDLPPRARGHYEQLNADMIAPLGRNGTIVAENAAGLSMKLCQLSSGVVYVHEHAAPVRVHPERMNVIDEVIEAAEGTPVLIFYRFVGERDWLLEKYPGRAFTTDTPDFIDRFNRDELPILVMHPLSGGAGLNLQKGSCRTVVWTSPSWSGEQVTQGNGRVYRQGQTQTTSIINIAARDTLDDLILATVEHKGDVEQTLLDYVEYI